MTENANPLLHAGPWPLYNQIRPEHVLPAVDHLIAEGERAVEALAQDRSPATWENFVEPQDDANERLARAFGQVTHLNAVVNTPALREAYQAALPKVTTFFTKQNQHPGLVRRFRELASSSHFSTLRADQRRQVELTLRDLRLSGADLPPKEREQFLAARQELAQLSSRFQDNVLDATDQFALYIDNEAELAGLPADVKAAMVDAARAAGETGFKVTLQMPVYLAVMQYADNRSLRETLYRAFFTRASEFGDAKQDNTPIIARILELRGTIASLLGMKNYAEVSLAAKMASTPGEVIAFLRELGAKAKPAAEREHAAIATFAAKNCGIAKLEPWDLAYASEKLRQARYDFSDDEVKQYFTEEAVLEGLFNTLGTLYGIRFERATRPVWHAHAMSYDVKDKTGDVIGHVYLDLYARDGKRSGAWMDDAVTRRRSSRGVQKPVVLLTCNFARPQGGEPARFTHTEVLTLFHEFGHGLHGLLSEVDALGVSGVNGVEWDAVELPSQFMEGFCWQWASLKPLTRHAKTGETMPKTLFDRMLAARNFASGLGTVRQLEFALFDMRLHSDFVRPADDVNGHAMLALLQEVRAEVAVVKPPAYHRAPNQFAHIFSGAYAAGYYSYKWAEVMAADAFEAFVEDGVLSAEQGTRFRREVLSRGASRPAMESFTAFRGRKPSVDALLRAYGLNV